MSNRIVVVDYDLQVQRCSPAFGGRWSASNELDEIEGVNRS